METVTLADTAVDYAAGGWPVFRLRGKTPLRGSGGFTDATTDTDQVRQWWKDCPDCNIGAAIPPSMAVVDVDAKAGGLITLHRLEEAEGVPDTLTALTGGGGLHQFFLHPGGELRQGAGILGPGIDTRMPNRGYVVLPPSVHESGRRYEWYDPDADAAPMPRWMVDRLRPEPPKPRPRRPIRLPKGNIDSRLRGVLSVLGPEGPHWNDRLHWAACRAGEMTLEGADAKALADALLDAAQPRNDREARNAANTIRSGMKETGMAP